MVEEFGQAFAALGRVRGGIDEFLDISDAAFGLGCRSSSSIC